MPTLLRGSEVAEILGTTTRTVRTLAACGELPKVRLGSRATRYLLSDVEDFIARRTSTSHAAGVTTESVEALVRPFNDDARGGQPAREVTTSSGRGRPTGHEPA